MFYYSCPHGRIILNKKQKKLRKLVEQRESLVLDGGVHRGLRLLLLGLAESLVSFSGLGLASVLFG